MIGRRSVPAAPLLPLLPALLRMARAMPTMAERLSVAVWPCMVLICQWGKDHQQPRTSPLSSCNMMACPEAMTVRQRLSVNA